MSTLTDRYVHAVTSQLPEEQREEIALELRATIADSIEGRAGDGEEAERAVLQDLGHPTLLADGYRGRGRALIGPAVYPAWLAMVTLLLKIVPAFVGVIAVLVALAEQESAAKVVAAGLGGAIQAALQVVLWVTLAFAIVERTDADPDSLPLVPHRDWTPDHLPEVSDDTTRVGWGEGATMILSCTLGIVFLTVANRLVHVDGQPLPILSDTAMTWRWVPVAGLALGIVTAAFVLVARRWTLRTAGLNLVSNVLFAVPVVWLLATRDLFHPEMVDVVLIGPGRDWVDLNHTVLIVIVLAFVLWDTVDVYRRALRSRTDAPTRTAVPTS